jgi:transcriptional regulator with XRE-family HTH domain
MQGGRVAVSAKEAIPNNVLYNLRDARALSLQDVADGLNQLAEQHGVKGHHVSVNTVSRWERGVIPLPEPINRRLLSEFYGVPLDRLGFTRPRAVSHDQAGEPRPRLGVGQPGELQPMPLDDRPVPLDAHVQRNQREWIATREGLNQHRVELARLAARWHTRSRQVERTELLTHTDWLPAFPVELADIELAWRGDQVPVEVTGTERQAQAVRPLRASGQRYHRYTHALRDLDRPALFENRISFRLLDAAWPKSGGGRLGFGMTTYFDAVDVSEAIAHELATAHLAFTRDGAEVRRGPGRRLPFRKLAGDPFDLGRRPVLPSVDTLTIRRSAASASFVLHRRDAGSVAVAGGMYHIMPAGVFQPSCVSPWACSLDFDLWRNMMREYSEEFLGNLEHDGNASAPIDYETQEPFRSLNQARREGKVRVYCLGVGLDPLTLWGEILTVAVFDDDAFDQVFGDLVAANNEGTVVAVGGPGVRGIPFTQERVDQLLGREPFAPAAAVCLALAWRHRAMILSG